MIDHGALGTLLIGLNAERAENQEHGRMRTAVRRHREHVGLRVTLARGLRHAAALLDRPTAGEVAR